jgi:(2S)-methylsuccinyl-CoA dehydrogenase
MSQNEIVRPPELGLAHAAADLAAKDAVASFISGDWTSVRSELAAFLTEGQQLDESLDDETLDSFRAEIRRFSDERVLPGAHKWHLDDALIPDEIVHEMAALGVFGLCLDPEYGGLGLGQLAMCVVTEELSRAWIAAGSLGTRSEIAGELIAHAGTEEQKRCWLPKIASGEFLPPRFSRSPTQDPTWETFALAPSGNRMAAGNRYPRIQRAFNVRRGKASRRSRQPISGEGHERKRNRGARLPRNARIRYRIRRLRRTDARTAWARRGPGLQTTDAHFEGARIQTASRAVGVARRALELGLSYAMDRRQFGQPIINFPRISDKLATTTAEILLAREATYRAARAKDDGRRCDIEAGMAKLIAARVAWSAADASLQIHGGNGYALEYEISRVLCDARILNIFEGAAEIQAQVVARGLLQQ